MQEELQKLKEEFDQRIKELEGKYKSEEEWPIYGEYYWTCLLYTSPSPRDGLLSRMPSSA